MELSPTAYVILGMLDFRPKSGYEIKAFVDRSTRFFWAASYGQIYPELRKLADAGLIEGTDSPQGGRQRTIFDLTDSGRDALHAWLAIPPEVLEMRHEGMLKLFFAGSLQPRDQVERLRDLKRQHAEKLDALRAIEPAAASVPESFPYLVLRFGIGFNEWAVEWCEREMDALESRVAERSS